MREGGSGKNKAGHGEKKKKERSDLGSGATTTRPRDWVTTH